MWLNSGSSMPSLPPLGAANAQEASDVDMSGIIEMVLGAEDAPIEMIEYASFTCPHCADFHLNVMGKIKADYIDTGKVRFIYRDVYFDRFGLWASMVARCGGADKFFGVSDLIYKQQKEWLAGGDPATIVSNLRKIGKVAGLTDEGLDACLSDGDNAKALVAWYQKNAEMHDINSTPSFVIDGEKYSNMSYESFKEILDAKLDG
ncbi:MAG: DsbA family protein [Rhodobacterales bacterium]|nr:DsbA family protein [Rhodobacterales bacterium]